MKRLILLIVACLALNVYAQDSVRVFKFGYLSYEEALQHVPGYELVQQTLSDLRAQYDAEQKRVEQDFNIKYEEFLEGLHDFPETILRKRQTELKELLERNLAFKAESRRELQKAETEAYAPLRKRLEKVLATIGRERGYAFILNTDANSVPFIHPDMGEDIRELVQTALTPRTPTITRNVF